MQPDRSDERDLEFYEAPAIENLGKIDDVTRGVIEGSVVDGTDNPS